MVSPGRRSLYNMLSGVELAHVGLYVWLLVGKVLVVVGGEIPLPGASEVVRAGWLFVGFAAPLMVFAAYWAIRWRAGRWRVAGFWLRLGGDVSQAAIMTIFTANLIGHEFGEDDYGHHYFIAISFMAALLSFLASMIVRDVLALVMVERLAWRIRRGHE